MAGAHLDSKLRAEISEIADTLQGNLDKVVQHGKRADAIVKNMLLHSRQGSGEHRPVDINALVEESLNLAYHGARAEKQGFNITLERSFDPAAGEVDLFPQEITRVLLNLISNGFYAATKRKAEANGGDYEPTLAAATKNLGDSVEIRIRDNGTGIPPEVKEKLFNPFFTTKPAGEGTGLGLSISHDIIVKQHGGSIEVDTQPGEFTEFRIVLPRAGCVPHQVRRTRVNLLILVVDDEPDVEVLFRQQFRRDLRAGRFTMEFAQSAPMALQRITDAGERVAHPDPVRHQHGVCELNAPHERETAFMEPRGLYRERNGWGNQHSARVKYDEHQELDLPEDRYRERGYQPPFNELPWRDEAANDA